MLKNKNIWDDPKLIKIIKDGELAVMPTDTIYGIVGNALDKDVVNKIYNTRKRSPSKPCIILVGDIKELKKFSIILTVKQKDVLKKYWPGPVSIILDCLDDRFAYLHRGTMTLAFRIPKIKELQKFLLKSGPVIAPSANTEGESPSKNIQDAKKYFEDNVQYYVDNGDIVGKSSTVIKLDKDGSIKIIRK